jgi:hypothetical protein
VAILIIIAALGSADWITRWTSARRAATSRALPAVLGAWTLISVALAATGIMPDIWTSGVNEAQLSAQVRGDPALCGLALYDIPFVVLPGRERLVGRSPLYAFNPADPVAARDLAAMVRKAAPAFNRILAQRDTAKDLPAGFARGDCKDVNGADVCIFARAGGCDAAAAASFDLNDVLERVGINFSRVPRVAIGQPVEP